MPREQMGTPTGLNNSSRVHEMMLLKLGVRHMLNDWWHPDAENPCLGSQDNHMLFLAIPPVDYPLHASVLSCLFLNGQKQKQEI